MLQIDYDFAARGQLVYFVANLSLVKTPSNIFPSYYNILTIISNLNKINQQGGMLMNAKNDDQSFDHDMIEKWLENYFLDPLTSYYDQTQFRIDLFETDKDWIVEALLPDFCSSEIKVYVEDKKLLITVKRNPYSIDQVQISRSRSIEFPFQVNCQKIMATFHNGILEVFISKLDKVFRKNRFITLP